MAPSDDGGVPRAPTNRGLGQNNEPQWPSRRARFEKDLSIGRVVAREVVFFMRTQSGRAQRAQLEPMLRRGGGLMRDGTMGADTPKAHQFALALRSSDPQANLKFV